ncbi:hypothetical protein ACTJKS_24110, partial [Pseudomonas sp. 22189]|uniref:hypothetical protein n=1 Tax=Pseudomonas sp. 22189 TaxID=3453889 RepID=UPI003F843611
NIYGACTTAFASRLAPTGKLSAFSQNLVGCQAAIAGKPAPTRIDWIQLDPGRLSGRLRWQASSHKD